MAEATTEHEATPPQTPCIPPLAPWGRQLLHPVYGLCYAWDPYYAGVPYRTYEVIDGNKATGQVWIPATDSVEVRAYVLAFMGLFMRDRDSPYVYVRR